MVDGGRFRLPIVNSQVFDGLPRWLPTTRTDLNDSAIPDGLYWTSFTKTDAKMRVIATVKGRLLYLEQAFTEKIDEIDLFEPGDGIPDYILVVRQNNGHWAGPYYRPMVLILNGKAVMFTGYSQGKKEKDATLKLPDPSWTKEVETYFRIKEQPEPHVERRNLGPNPFLLNHSRLMASD
jgi:hypothetical protein